MEPDGRKSKEGVEESGETLSDIMPLKYDAIADELGSGGKLFGC